MMKNRNRNSMPGYWLGLFALVLAISMSLGISGLRADDTKVESAFFEELQQDVELDEEFLAFDDPVLVRAKARVAPVWRGPLGQPPWTERRNCPEMELDSFDIPPYC